MKFSSLTTVKKKFDIYLAYNSSTSLSDAELINQVANGDVEAFEKLFVRYWDELYEITYRRVLSKRAAKAILVDVFETVWKNKKTLPNTFSVKDYLYSTLQCQIFSYYGRHPQVLKKLIKLSKTIDCFK